MKNQLLYLFISCFLLAACQQEKSIPGSFTKKNDQLANRYLALDRFSGTILVAQGDQLLFHQSYGLADYSAQQSFTEDTAFKIGELSELFTAYIIHQMEKEDQIDISHPINTYLPTVEAKYTIQEILGKKYNPEEIDYHLLDQLIEKQLDISYQQAIEKYFPPLGIHQTFFQQENTTLAKGYLFHNYRGQGLELEEAPHYKEAPAFSSARLKSTAHDLWKFSLLLTNQSIHKSGYLENDGFSYTFQKDTLNDLVIIILSNRRHPVSEEIAKSIKAIYRKTPYELPLLRQTVTINPKLYVDYVGTYEVNPNFKFEVIQKKDSLFTVMGGQKTHLIPQSANQFYYRDFDAAIRFVQDSNGLVSKAVLYNSFLNGQMVHKKTER